MKWKIIYREYEIENQNNDLKYKEIKKKTPNLNGKKEKKKKNLRK